jgi:hypothetical protein
LVTKAAGKPYPVQDHIGRSFFRIAKKRKLSAFQSFG